MTAVVVIIRLKGFREWFRKQVQFKVTVDIGEKFSKG